MNLNILLLAALCLQTTSVAPTGGPVDDPPAVCDSCEGWNKSQTPFRLHGRSYYVGVRGLSSVLIQTSDGLILLDGGLPQSAPLIEANIRSLGFRVEDIKLILNSHAHYDHAGGLARLQRDSGSIVAASPAGAQALLSGRPVPEDPQYNEGKDGGFPRVRRVNEVKDGETLGVGDTEIKAHLTPGHTPGSTTWTWVSCASDGCLNMVYADSLTPVSSGPFRFLGDERSPDVSGAFRHSIDTVRGLPCDIMLSTHPEASGLFDRLERRTPSLAVDPLIDRNACRAYADKANGLLDDRLKAERVRQTR